MTEGVSSTGIPGGGGTGEELSDTAEFSPSIPGGGPVTSIPGGGGTAGPGSVFDALSVSDFGSLAFKTPLQHRYECEIG